MKTTVLLPMLTLLLAGTGSAAWSQQIYRCEGIAGGPPEYINNAKDAQARNCKTMTGGNITVVQGTAPAPVAVAAAAAPAPRAPVRVAAASPSGGTPRTDNSAEQRARDSDSRAILESELKKAEAKLAEQQKEYNNGEPEKQGIEGRNYQRYLDRVADMKDSIARHQSDVAGLKREISRLPSSAN